MTCNNTIMLPLTGFYKEVMYTYINICNIKFNVLFNKNYIILIDFS